MLSAVLKTPVAVDASIAIARTFVRLRRAMLENKILARRLARLETKVGDHDAELRRVLDVIGGLMESPPEAPGRIGFKADAPGAAP